MTTMSDTSTASSAPSSKTSVQHATAGIVVFGLRCSRTFQIAVEVYQNHIPGSGGSCCRCGRAGCRSRGHAEKIIVAAGEDSRASAVVPVSLPSAVAAASPTAGPGASPLARGERAGLYRPATAVPRQPWPGLATQLPIAHLPAGRPMGIAQVASAFRSLPLSINSVPVRSDGDRMRDVGPVTHDPYSLRGLLFCACDQPYYPLELAAGGRAYAAVCGCRLWPLNAITMERLVLETAEREAPALFVGVPTARHGAVFRRLFARVSAGGAGYDLSFVRRI
jgi:hypothetical protein